MQFLFTNTPLKFLIQSFWRDEAFTYLLAKQSLMDILKLTAKDYNPPLYYLLLHGWMKLFGTSEIALRIMSFIFFLATLYVIYLYLTQILHIKIKRAYTYLFFLFAVNPLLLYYAFEARMYTLFAFLSVLSFYFFASNRKKAYVIVSVLGLYTHYFMAFVLLSQWIFSLCNRFKPIATDSNRFQPISTAFSRSVFLIFTCFLPWLLFLLFQKPPLSSGFWIAPLTFQQLLDIPGRIVTGYEYELEFYNKYIRNISYVVFIITTFLYTIGRKNNETKNQMKFLAMWVFVPLFFVLVISFFKPIFLPRYLILISIGFLLFIVYLMEHAPKFLRYVFLLIFFLVTLHYGFFQITYREKADLKKVVHEIKALAKSSDVLYVTSELDFHTAQYYFGENRVFIYGKTYEEIPSFVGKILIPKNKIVHSLPTYPSKAFILNPDLSYNIKTTL